MTAYALGDRADFLHVNDLARATGWLHAPAVAYAVYGVVLFAGLLGAALLSAWRSSDERLLARALLAPAGVLTAVALNQPVGHLVREARPYDQLTGVLVLVPRTTDFSFPSDHAVMAGAVAVGVLLVSRRLGLLAVAAALLLAAGRVYVGAHFPLDVLAGLLLGAAVEATLVLLLEPAVAASVVPLVRRLLPVPRARLAPARDGSGG